MDSCGIQTWTILDKTIRYTSAQTLLSVRQTNLPEGTAEDEITPDGNMPPATGEEVSVVMVPGFDPGRVERS